MEWDIPSMNRESKQPVVERGGLGVLELISRQFYLIRGEFGPLCGVHRCMTLEGRKDKR